MRRAETVMVGGVYGRARSAGRGVAELLQLYEDLGRRLIGRLSAVGVADHLGVQWLLVRVVDPGEVADLADHRLAVEPLDVPIGEDLERSGDVDLHEAADVGAHL